MTFSLQSTSCLLKLPTDTASRTANWPRLKMTNHMTRHRRSTLYGASIIGAYFLLIFNTHTSFQSCNRRSTTDTRRPPRQHFFEIAIYRQNKCGKPNDELPVEGSMKDTVLQCQFVDECKAMDMKQTSNCSSFNMTFRPSAFLRRGTLLIYR